MTWIIIYSSQYYYYNNKRSHNETVQATHKIQIYAQDLIFYSNRVIYDRNSLPQSIVDSPSVNDFKIQTLQ